MPPDEPPPHEAARCALQRHDLVRLHATAWEALVAEPRDADSRALLRAWSDADHPLVVASQPPWRPAQALRLGLPAPSARQRVRLSLQVPPAGVRTVGAFPAADDITALLPDASQAAWQAVCRALAAIGASGRVFGSHGWQWLTGLAYLHPRSDLDLLVAVDGAAQADAAAAVLAHAEAAAGPLPRLDGELRFPDGSAVAWREWQACRAGRCRQVMVKRLRGVSLADTVDGIVPACSEARVA